MMRIKKTMLLLLLMPLLSSCWDHKNIQDINYFIALGFDYIDDHYVVYGQMIDFTSIAKTESGKPSQPTPVWVGKGEGETIAIALNRLYETAQMRVMYGEISAFVYGMNLLKKQKLKDVFEFQRTYFELRYTSFVFGTKDPIDELFAVTPFFYLSPIKSLLHQPKERYRQLSIIPPLTYRELIMGLNEPGNTTLLPTLAITDEDWKKNNKKHPVMDIDGVFVFDEGLYRGWLKDKSIMGYRWVVPQTIRSPLLIWSDNKMQAVISLKSPKINILPEIRDDHVVYTLEVKLKGDIVEYLQKQTESELEHKTAMQVTEEIMQTFKEGLSFRADLLHLEHHLYRQNNKEWKRMRQLGALEITEDSLKDVHVDMKLQYSGKDKVFMKR